MRDLAILHLSTAREGSNDPRLGGFLAGLVRDEQEPARVRQAAYRGLIVLRGLSLSWRPPLPAFPHDVNWEFVESFNAG